MTDPRDHQKFQSGLVRRERSAAFLNSRDSHHAKLSVCRIANRRRRFAGHLSVRILWVRDSPGTRCRSCTSLPRN
jgi:hypothetical protein